MIAALIPAVTQLLDKFIPDTEEKARLAHEIATMSERHAQQLALAQIEVNKHEANSGDAFRAGWRPSIGYICAGGFAVNFLISPIAAGFGVIIPQADTSTMMPVLLGMLGLGTLRTYEKKSGVSK